MTRLQVNVTFCGNFLSDTQWLMFIGQCLCDPFMTSNVRIAFQSCMGNCSLQPTKTCYILWFTTRDAKDMHYLSVIAMRGTHVPMVDSPHNGPAVQKAFPYHDVSCPISIKLAIVDPSHRLLPTTMAPILCNWRSAEIADPDQVDIIEVDSRLRRICHWYLMWIIQLAATATVSVWCGKV